jgi:pyridoxamine 5'-phosphate oxidase
MTERFWDSGQQYSGPRIDPSTAAPDPFRQFRAWMSAAVDASVHNANAMTLATVDGRGRPAARIVLLKEVDDRGLTFYTNYGSRKGSDLEACGFAALVFFWDALHRQVRVEGSVERVSAEESDAYFAVRPRGSQLSAIASPQSQVVSSRDSLEQVVRELETRYAVASPPRPPAWGGYRVVPDAFEFWQGQESRMHDRVRYRLEDATWVRERLAP